MQFKDIIGQQTVKQHLISTVKESRISHAQLFLGPEGSAGLSLAIAYAQYINCEQKSADDSCGSCASCRKYQKLIHPDLHFSYPFFAKHKEDTAADYMDEWRKCLLNNPYMDLESWRSQLDTENKQANINIAEAHHIIKKLSLKAFEAEYKVLILWLPEYLETQANALLKLIEEPPSKTLFLLVAVNPDRLLPTLISRTQLIKIQRYSHEEIAGYLQKHYPAGADQAAQAALISDGNIQRAIALLTEESNEYFDLLIQWLRFCVTDSGLSLITFSDDRLAKLGRENQKSLLLYTIGIIRQVLLMKENVMELVRLTGTEHTFAEKFSSLYTTEQLEQSVTVFEQAFYHVERNANSKILFLDVSLQLVLIFKYATFRQQADSLYT